MYQWWVRRIGTRARCAQFSKLVHEIISFQGVLYEKGVLKNFSKLAEKHKKQSSGGVLSKNAKFCKICRKTSLPESLFNNVVGWKPETVRSSHWRCSIKQDFLKKFANFTWKNLCWSLFLIKFQFWGPLTVLEKDCNTGISL